MTPDENRELLTSVRILEQDADITRHLAQRAHDIGECALHNNAVLYERIQDLDRVINSLRERINVIESWNQITAPFQES